MPAVWWFEIRNTLLVGERRGLIDEAGTLAFLDDIRRLGVVLDREPDEIRLLSMARQNRLTIYDAAYYKLAKRQDLPLATLDKALRQAAAAVGVAPVSAAA